MARLEVWRQPKGGHAAVVILSRRNLLTLLHKLDMPGSLRMFMNGDCWVDGEQVEPGVETGRWLLVLRCEDDLEHYARRKDGPGPMHPDTEAFVTERGGVAGEGAIVPGFGYVHRRQRHDD